MATTTFRILREKQEIPLPIVELWINPAMALASNVNRLREKLAVQVVGRMETVLLRGMTTVRVVEDKQPDRMAPKLVIEVAVPYEPKKEEESGSESGSGSN